MCWIIHAAAAEPNASEGQTATQIVDFILYSLHPPVSLTFPFYSWSFTLFPPDVEPLLRCQQIQLSIYVVVTQKQSVFELVQDSISLLRLWKVQIYIDGLSHWWKNSSGTQEGVRCEIQADIESFLSIDVMR